VRLIGRHLIANIEPTELRPDHRNVVACVISKVYRTESTQIAYHCHNAHLNPVSLYVWKTAIRLTI